MDYLRAIFSALCLFHLVNGQCRSGWEVYQNSCYLFANVEATWHEAQIECITIHGGYLAEIESPAENNFLMNEAKMHHATDPSDHNYGYWIGGSDMEVEGDYIWMKSKHQFNFTDWSPGQPDNQRHEDCVHLNGNYGFLWNDAPCSLKAYYICEKLMSEVEIIG